MDLFISDNCATIICYLLPVAELLATHAILAMLANTKYLTALKWISPYDEKINTFCAVFAEKYRKILNLLHHIGIICV